MDDTLNSLLRGEISAAETYKQALDGLDGEPQAQPLRGILQQHGDAIRYLHEQIQAQGGVPANSSGAWGVFARTMEGAAKILGNAAALSALRRGEQQGLIAYEKAVEESTLPTECRVHFQQELIPRQRRHIEVLDRMIAAS